MPASHVCWRAQLQGAVIGHFAWTNSSWVVWRETKRFSSNVGGQGPWARGVSCCISCTVHLVRYARGSQAACSTVASPGFVPITQGLLLVTLQVPTCGDPSISADPSLLLFIPIENAGGRTAAFPVMALMVAENKRVRNKGRLGRIRASRHWQFSC